MGERKKGPFQFAHPLQRATGRKLQLETILKQTLMHVGSSSSALTKEAPNPPKALM